ncbi:hypothetical protein [Pseudomonas sp. GV071]|jgi:hypothetical protein|uniref:hypothetical protein n=1 Tax=Pseudomonas sp. GV071 TaxID=2135754 RepID=UPI000D39AF24|nr:hypothetical protein [Pseudomonas sp. GV071]PTQ67883.1 hypothetical protein C8K61_11355 [Pseudomonas sp. GV071]
MAMNEWALLGVVLNLPLLAYLLIRWWFNNRFTYVGPSPQPNAPLVDRHKHQSPPVSGAGPPDAGTGGETG